MSLTPTKAQQDEDRRRALADLQERVEALVAEVEKGRKHAELLARELKVVHKEKRDLRAQRDAALNRVRELEGDPLFGTLQEIGDGWRDRATTAERLVVELGKLAARRHSFDGTGFACRAGMVFDEKPVGPCNCGAVEHNARVGAIVAQLPEPVVQSIPRCAACFDGDHARCSGWCSCHLTGCPGGAT